MIPGARTIPNVFVNGASIFSGEIMARLATALMALVVAHFFGSIALGDYGYALALASILIVVPDCGLHLFAVRELSASPRRLPEIFWGIHWVKLGLIGAVVAFTLFFGAFWHRRSEPPDPVLCSDWTRGAPDLFAGNDGNL